MKELHLKRKIRYDKKIVLSKKLHDGYEIFYDLDHPLADKAGYVKYHRHVASIAAGRWVERYEDVHHIDSNRSNNSPDNLLILTKSEHHRLHHKLLGKNLHDFKPTICQECGNTFLPVAEGQKYCNVDCFTKYRKDNSIKRKFKKCPICRKLYRTYKNGQMYCSDYCSIESRTIKSITQDELEKLVLEMPLTKIAEKYGVSVHTIINRCKKFNIVYPGNEVRNRKFNLTKEELSKLVGNMTLNEIAKMYNVSGATVSVNCKRLGISVPDSSHWGRGGRHRVLRFHKCPHCKKLFTMKDCRQKYCSATCLRDKRQKKKGDLRNGK